MTIPKYTKVYSIGFAGEGGTPAKIFSRNSVDSRDGGKLNLVDLAGSERQSKTGSTVSTSLLSDVPVLVMKMSGCKRASCILVRHFIMIISL